MCLGGPCLNQEEVSYCFESFLKVAGRIMVDAAGVDLHLHSKVLLYYQIFAQAPLCFPSDESWTCFHRCPKKPREVNLYQHASIM